MNYFAPDMIIIVYTLLVSIIHQILFLFTHPVQGLRKPRTYPVVVSRGEVHPGQIFSLPTGTTMRNRHLFNHLHLKAILKSPTKLTCMSLDCGQREPMQTQGDSTQTSLCNLALYHIHIIELEVDLLMHCTRTNWILVQKSTIFKESEVTRLRVRSDPVAS